jgi:hypothetical protein
MLDLSVSNQEIKINGYDIVRKDRNRHGGGVAIYIRTSINFIIRDDLTDDNLETITLEISKPKAKPCLINSWYKPPNTTLEIFNAFEDLITRMDSRKSFYLEITTAIGLAWIVTALTLRQTSVLELLRHFNFNN